MLRPIRNRAQFRLLASLCLGLSPALAQPPPGHDSSSAAPPAATPSPKQESAAEPSPKPEANAGPAPSRAPEAESSSNDDEGLTSRASGESTGSSDESTQAPEEPPATAPSPKIPKPSASSAERAPKPSGNPKPTGRPGQPSAETAAPSVGTIFEPPLPAPPADYHVPPPPRPQRVSPEYSLVLGGRFGWFFPSGNLWADGLLLDRVCCLYRGRPWQDVASSGPGFELDAGVRVAHHYVIFAAWEFTRLGSGDTLGDEFGGQDTARSHFLGGGVRFSGNPDEFGPVLEIALGWRRFEATWETGTELTTTDTFLSSRIGFGLDYRVSPLLTLSPMFTVSGGVFNEADWKFADGSEADAFSDLGRTSQHTLMSLQLGATLDLLGDLSK